MGTLRDKANEVLTNSSSDIQRQSSKGSISSTTSNLLKQNKENNSFDNLEATAQKERNRLSSMLDSYKNSSEVTQSTTNDTASFIDADDFIINRKSIDGQQRDFIVPVRKTQSRSSENDHFEFEKSDQAVNSSSNQRIPSTIQLSPSLNVQNNGAFPSPTSQRRSLYSDYAPSIHEVNKVAYVVDGSDQYDDDKISDDIDEDLPVENELKPTNIQRKPSVIKVSRNSSKNSGKVTTPDQQQHIKNKESLASYYSIAQSGSGSSKYPESTYSTTRDSPIGDMNDQNSSISNQQQPPSHPDIQNNPYKSSPSGKIPEESESTSSFEFNIGPLKTTKESRTPIAVDRSHVTSIDPAIPSRSRRRPVSQAFINSPINKLKTETDANRPRSVDLGEMDNLMSELNREIYNSPNGRKQNFSEESGFQTAKDYGHSRQQSNVDSIRSNAQDKSIKRPLPPPPVPKHEKKPSVSYEEEQMNPEPSLEQPKHQVEHHEHKRDVSTTHDDGFVTEDEDAETKSTKALKKKHHKKSSESHQKKRSSSSSAFKKGHFNHETLTQLLQVTEGTIIGQEFQNIGLESTEKQLLERLVDSLSRLTADMVIDSDRHDESVKRLNKAIKALEGF
ncbi:Muscle M-line assembly protein unc-89 [Wickerhamomyces ciferrii]|uniref:Muscle M-line assembly protein unc-89 n=1 Tax=Wickerhamomyces ciferrii (strain ATCC 14091 / BCRC 22168 / CBS 111 / JCM 3599 / NBRC 0793 / NRRL Y-1031 F-60-10) TaxID=1206466 RepID=K0KJK0_WICCF|nr:Muscle M-line assembly protein unc-89 [Wickerhamomyces ciferrii]CCH45440.1 Muscle M-line assembly protein unc-89 [Wickerhamomyces ciferrii]